MDTRSKIILSFLLLAVTLSGWLHYAFQQHHNIYQEKALERAVAAFVTAKTLNGLISVIQGTEVSAAPAGVGVNFAVGEIVDPMNDLIERFSWVMLASIASLGIQQILLGLGETMTFNAILSGFAFIALTLLWYQNPWIYKVQNLFLKIVLILFLARVFMPFVAFVDSLMYTHVFETSYTEATQKLTMTQNALESEQDSPLPSTQTADQTLADRVFGWFQTQIKTIQSTLDPRVIQERLNRLEVLLEEATNHIITLLSQFIFSSIMLPLFALWILYRMIATIIQIR